MASFGGTRSQVAEATARAARNPNTASNRRRVSLGLPSAIPMDSAGGVSADNSSLAAALDTFSPEVGENTGFQSARTTTDRTSETDERTNRSGSERQVSTSIDNVLRDATESTTNRSRTQNITDEALEALNQALADTPNDPFLQAIDRSRNTAIQEATRLLQNFNRDEIQAGAEGDVAALSRQLTEEALPAILGETERGGTSNNALAALLGQDAAIRIGEAQARVRETARSNAAAELDRIQRTLSDTLAANDESAVLSAMNELIGLSKGAVTETVDQQVRNLREREARRSSTETAREFSEEERRRSRTEDRTTSTTEQIQQAGGGGAGSGGLRSGSGGLNAQALAMLMAGLTPSQTLQDLSGNPFSNPGRSQASIDSARSVNELAARLGVFG